jgi:type I restriction enzyme S subunit
MNVVFFGFKRDGLAFIDEYQASALDGATVRAHDILLNITGASIGRVTLAPQDMDGARVNQHVCIIRPNSSIDSRYLRAYLSSPALQSKIWADNTGTTRQALTKQQILGFEIPIAPLAEQRRIADKLDTVLARVDAVNDRLSRVLPLLKRFRQSVLAAATSGRLMKEWRLQAELDLDDGYATCRLSEVATSRLGKMLDKQKNTGVETTYLRNINVRWFGFDLSDLQTLRIEPDERESLRVLDGDVLICEGGEPGRCAVWRSGATDTVFQKALHRVRPDPEKVLPEWIAYCIKWLCDSGKLNDLFTGTTIKHLTGISLSKVVLPMPPLTEQAEIVRRVELLFAYADRLEGRLKVVQNATARLTPALLAKAFRGELVPQDPDDEPASKLLRGLRAVDAPVATKSDREGTE